MFHLNEDIEAGDAIRYRDGTTVKDAVFLSDFLIGGLHFAVISVDKIVRTVRTVRTVSITNVWSPGTEPNIDNLEFDQDAPNPFLRYMIKTGN